MGFHPSNTYVEMLIMVVLEEASQAQNHPHDTFDFAPLASFLASLLPRAIDLRSASSVADSR